MPGPDPYTFIECGDRILVPAGLQEQGTLLVECLCIIPVFEKGLVKLGDGILVLSELGKRKTLVVQSVCIIGADLQRLVVRRNCLGKAPEVGIGEPHLECGRSAPGIEDKCLFERLDGLLEPAQFRMGKTPVIVRSGMVLLQVKAFGECVQCVLVLAQVDAGNTFLVPCIGIYGRQGERLFKINNGFLVLLQPQERNSPSIVCRSTGSVYLKVFRK